MLIPIFFIYLLPIYIYVCLHSLIPSTFCSSLSPLFIELLFFYCYIYIYIYKADYERNKQFEKLTIETVAKKEKMEKMQLAFRKAQGMDDCLYNMGGISSKTPIALPPKFKIFDAEKFDGTGDPKQHVRRYLNIVKMKGLDEKQNLHAFPLSLMGGASRWYHSLDPSKTKV